MDIYKISIALAMSSNHNAILSALGAQLLHVHSSVGQLTGSFNRLKLAIGGALAIGAGIAILDTMKKLVDTTKDYNDELVKIQNLGGPMGEAAGNGTLGKAAMAMTGNSQLKITDLLKIQGNLNSLVGAEKAKELWQPIADYEWVAQFRDGYSGDPSKSMTKVLRAGELSGRVTDPITTEAGVEQTKKWLDLVTRIVSATHGMVNESTLLGLAQQMGPFGRGLTDEGFMTQAIMAQAMGGQRAGTAYMSTYQQMASGAMFARTAQAMQDQGLLGKDEWHNDHGRVQINDEASKRLSGLVNKDPLALAAKFRDQFKKEGVTDPEEQMRLVIRAMGRQTSQRYTAEEVLNFQQMIDERERMKMGLGVAGSGKNIDSGSITANEQALTNAWYNLQVAVAGPNSENVIWVLKELTGAVNYMKTTISGWDPNTIKTIAEGIAVLGLAFVGAGAVALFLALGTGGWIAAGIIAIAAAAAKWGPDILKGVFNGLQGLADAANRLVDWIAGLLSKIKGLLFSDGTSKPSATVDDMGRVIPQSFHPGNNTPKAQPISLNLSVDGRSLAQATSEHLSDLMDFPTGAPAANSYSQWQAGHHQLTST